MSFLNDNIILKFPTMEKVIIKIKFWVMAFIIPCLCNLSCKNPNPCSQSPEEIDSDIIPRNCKMDTLMSGVLCASVGFYSVLDYSYVSPSTARRYAFDFEGRKVFEDGYTYSGAYAFTVWDYDEDGRLKTLYWSASFEPSVHETVDSDDGLPMLVTSLTGCSLNDPAVEKFIFDYHPDGHIRSVYDPDNNHEIVCPFGGEIIFRIYQMDGDNTSKLVGNYPINIEFHVREPKAGVWMETLYLGYRQIFKGVSS